uniref:ribonuclease H n=1 Tax=Paramormyrops kingsleyae TaxID=1676925 RepID=A0A3B3RHH0_9TELE
MNVIHPEMISQLESIPFLIGKDLLNRFEPLLDFQRQKIWAQVREPLPLWTPDTATWEYQNLAVSSDLTPHHGENAAGDQCFDARDPYQHHDSFLCRQDPTLGSFCPKIGKGMWPQGMEVTDVVMTMEIEESPVTKETVCHVELADDQHLTIHAITTQPDTVQAPSCHSYSQEGPAAPNIVDTPTPMEPSQNHYFDENVCQDMITIYVDGCSFKHQGTLKAGAGILWLNDDPVPPQQLKLGPHTSQYAELAAILIALEVASEHGVQDLLLCTDSNYTRLSFMCHLPHWKQNGFKTSGNKPVKHQDLLQACDVLITAQNMNIYWKKVCGHSRLPELDKMYNNHTDALAKAGALHGDCPLPPTHAVQVVTCSHSRAPTSMPEASLLELSLQVSNSDIVSLQPTDAVLNKVCDHLRDLSANSISTTDQASLPDIHHLIMALLFLHFAEGVPLDIPDAHTSPRLVVPQAQRGVML